MPISINDIERIEGTFEAKNFEFIYLDHYPVKEGKSYQILYTKDKKERKKNEKKWTKPLRNIRLYKRVYKRN